MAHSALETFLDSFSRSCKDVVGLGLEVGAQHGVKGQILGIAAGFDHETVKRREKNRAACTVYSRSKAT